MLGPADYLTTEQITERNNEFMRQEIEVFRILRPGVFLAIPKIQTTEKKVKIYKPFPKYRIFEEG